jgi:hypothetical protein
MPAFLGAIGIPSPIADELDSAAMLDLPFFDSPVLVFTWILEFLAEFWVAQSDCVC